MMKIVFGLIIINTVFGGTVDLSAYATKAEMNSGLNSKINTSAIKNDLTTGGVTNVLSAEQGKILK